MTDEPLPGLAMSEADVVKLIFRLSADEGKSCAAIATHLNRLAIPTAYLIPGHATGGGSGAPPASGVLGASVISSSTRSIEGATPTASARRRNAS